MWFPSREKVARKLDEFIVRMEKLSGRITQYEEQEQLSARLGMPGNGQVAETRETHSYMLESLTAASVGIRSGQFDFKEIHSQIPSIDKAISHIEWILDEADKDVAQAKRAFRERFGGN